MKVSILYNFKDGPWGGGNQFLKALRNEWKRQDLWSESIEDADVIFVNSFPFRAEYFFDQIFQIKKRRPEVVVVYRLDGPISLIRGQDKQVDRMIARFNELLIDGIIFQSNWCLQKNQDLFDITSKYHTVIHNASDNKVFSRKKVSELGGSPIKLIATSWSSNPRKGFEIYSYLDQNLDSSRYQMTFVGNSPVKFKNIKIIEPVSSQELSLILKDHDIFITASKSDPCSNSLIEALSSGLPAVALDDGGHPEIIQRGGEVFTGKENVLEKIDLVANRFGQYQSQIPEFSIELVANKYFEFAKMIYSNVQENEYNPKQASWISFLNFKRIVFLWKIKNLIGSLR